MTDGPRAIGVIMDGNRRWAKERGLPSFDGHQAGVEKVHELAQWAHEAGIEEVTVYAFSTENWKRSEEEVGYLMKLFEKLFADELDRLLEAGVRIRFIGDRSLASARIQEVMRDTEEKTKDGTKGTLVFAFSYGGRPELLAAVNRLVAEGRKDIDETSFKEAMWSAGLMDPDLVIRTGGEHRLSNFLPWQSVYSELFFTDTKWPDLSREEFDAILAEYRDRDRRHGK